MNASIFNLGFFFIAVAVSVCSSNPCGSNPCFEAPTSPSGYVCACGVNDFRPTSCHR